MDYQQHIINVRDWMHKDLVQEACHKNYIINDNSDGVLQLHDPTYVRIKDEILLLVSIDCESGLPSVETYLGNFRTIRYCDLSVEDLADLHKQVVQQKQYSFTPHKELV